MRLLFRRMEEADVPDVFKIECDLFPDPWPLKAFFSELKQKETSFPFVVEEQNRIIGYIICWYYLNELHIGNVAVSRKQQGQGIGKFLLTSVFEYFVDYKTAFLEVRETNTKAILLYASFGFEMVYKRNRYYRNGDDALVMIKINDSDKSRIKNGLV